MALVCARCGTQNPDGNKFCQACGTPLTPAASAPAAPVGAVAASPFTQPPPPLGAPPGSPTGPPPAYQSPYYSPAAGGPQPVHRTPWVLIVSVVVILVLLMAGVGTVLAVIGLGKSSSQPTTFKSLSSPSPATSPSPVASPAPQPSPSGPGTASNPGVTVPVPAGWSVAQKDDQSITLLNPNGDGSVTVASGASNPPQTAQQNKDTIDKYFQQQYPDAASCPNSKTSNGSINGAPGIAWELCFTLTSGSQSLSAAALLFVGANADGSVYYAVYLITAANNMDSFVTEAQPVVQGIAWQLK